MLEQLTQSLQQQNAKRITQLRDKRAELVRDRSVLGQRIERINLEIADLLTVAEDTADVQAERMTVQQAETILAACEEPERWDGLS